MSPQSPVSATPFDPTSWGLLRPELRDSWDRSARGFIDPDKALAPVELSDATLKKYRETHPLAAVLPVLHSLLIEPASSCNLIVAVSDHLGRLLWVEGDHTMRSQAEDRSFMPGTNWSENIMGTSAPGTALALGNAVQVSGREHYASTVSEFSCTAVPLHHPNTGKLLGAVDLTGGDDAVAMHSLPLVKAAVAAAQKQLTMPDPLAQEQLMRVQQDFSSSEAASATRPAAPRIQGYADTTGSTSVSGAEVELGLEVLTYGESRVGSLGLKQRHAEILLLLSWAEFMTPGRGLKAEELAEQLYGETGREVTLRAEMARLRKILGKSGQGIDVLSRPYRFSQRLRCDAVEIMKALKNHDLDRALSLANAPLLPESTSPQVRQIAANVESLLRETVLEDGSSHQLMHYLETTLGADDQWAHQVALRELPTDSPQRTEIVLRLESWEDSAG